MSDSVFVDTNILIYAYDLDAGRKREIAGAAVKDLWEQQTGVVSNQVLQEFYVNVTRKIPNPLTKSEARAIIENYRYWQVELNGPETILSASEIEERYQLSFWDSLIVAAASNADARRILTEDLNHGQIVAGILIENPFI
jgi:predicted nucleic acid-binding protein